MMKKYKYIFFDLFDTLIDFDYSRLPQISVDGEKHNSTSGLVYEVFNSYYADVSFDTFYKSFMDTYFEFQEIKKKEYKEYPNQQRFRILFDKLNLNHKSNQNEILDNMTEAHMAGLASATTFSEDNRKTLDYLKKKGYVFALISNFDYAPTAYRLLDRYDLRKYFDKIYLSIEVGWRKPHKNIFQIALDECGIDNKEVIHVGDNFGADIVGSYNLGIDSIWLNKKDEELKHEIASPNYIIYKLTELTSLF
jgi:putative hydrolase of the HAD superfamily